MRGWLPAFHWHGKTMSDGFDDDAEGWAFEVEWFGVIVEVAVLFRGRTFD